MIKENKKSIWFIKSCAVLMILVMIACSSFVFSSSKAHASTLIDSNFCEENNILNYNGPMIDKQNAVGKSGSHRYYGPTDGKTREIVLPHDGFDDTICQVTNARLQFKSAGEAYDYATVSYDTKFIDAFAYESFYVHVGVDAYDSDGTLVGRAKAESQEGFSGTNKTIEIKSGNVYQGSAGSYLNPEKHVIRDNGSFCCTIKLTKDR